MESCSRHFKCQKQSVSQFIWLLFCLGNGKEKYLIVLACICIKKNYRRISKKIVIKNTRVGGAQ